MPVLIFLILFLVSSPIARAEPYLSVMAEAQCSHCHVNPTGAGMRSDHGVGLYTQYTLEKTRSFLDSDFKARVSKYLALGADVRLRHLSTIESPTSNSFTVPQGSLYVRSDPISKFSIMTDTDLANLVSREFFGLVHDLPANLWIKFGRMNVPYGLRIADDTSFIRNDLGFGYANQDIGLEVGLEPEPLTIAVAVTNGVPGGNADDNNNKAVTSSVSWLWDKVSAGGSFQWNDRLTTQTLTGGGHVGLHLWHLAFLGEFDAQKVNDKTTGIERTVLAGYGEMDYRIIRGLYLKGVYDVIDDRLAASGLHHRAGVGFDFFPIPFLQVSILYRLRVGNGALDNDQIGVAFHGFF